MQSNNSQYNDRKYTKKKRKDTKYFKKCHKIVNIHLISIFNNAFISFLFDIQINQLMNKVSRRPWIYANT